MHDGRDEGFIARFVAYPKEKSGFVVMINNDGAFGLLEEISNRISDVLNIPGFEPTVRTQISFNPTKIWRSAPPVTACVAKVQREVKRH